MPALSYLVPGAGLLLAALVTAAPGRPAGSGPPPRPATVPKDAVRGDFDGDGRAEYVWLVPPRLPDATSDTMDFACVGPCTSVLRSSNPTFQPYQITQSIGGELRCFSHLGPGRRDYLGILPAWFTSCWRGYYVLTYRQGRWQPGVPSFDTHCNQWEMPIAPIERDRRVRGHVLIRYSTLAGSDIVVKTKSVPLR